MAYLTRAGLCLLCRLHAHPVARSEAYCVTRLGVGYRVGLSVHRVPVAPSLLGQVIRSCVIADYSPIIRYPLSRFQCHISPYGMTFVLLIRSIV
jgi:hypothetical protein